MITITSTQINNRTDWYHAHAIVAGYSYDSFMATRMAAVNDILRKLAVKGYLTF